MGLGIHLKEMNTKNATPYYNWHSFYPDEVYELIISRWYYAHYSRGRSVKGTYFSIKIVIVILYQHLKPGCVECFSLQTAAAGIGL